MNLSDLNELELSDIGHWPAPAKAVLVLIACIAVAFGVYWFDTQHQIEDLHKLQNSEKGLRDLVTVKARRAANLEQYKRQLEEMKQSFGEMRRQLPSETEVAGLLVDISQTGLASGLEFELFQPGPENRKDFYAELPIQIRVTGSFHQFGTFASGIAALPRIVTLHNIHITHGGKDLVMTALAKTYRYLSDEEVAKK